MQEEGGEAGGEGSRLGTQDQASYQPWQVPLENPGGSVAELVPHCYSTQVVRKLGFVICQFPTAID